MYFRRAVATSSKMEPVGQLPEKNSRTRGSGSWKQRFRQRSRMTGNQGRPRKTIEVRVSLFEWWSTIRFSIDTKVMTRLPAKVIISKAKQLCRDWVTHELKRGCQVKAASGFQDPSRQPSRIDMAPTGRTSLLKVLSWHPVRLAGS